MRPAASGIVGTRKCPTAAAAGGNLFQVDPGSDAARLDRFRTNDGVPPAGGHFDLDGRVGLRLGGPVLSTELVAACSEAWIEAGADVVALLEAASLSPSRAASANHLIGFRQILLDADAARIQHAEIELAVGDAVDGGLAEPT